MNKETAVKPKTKKSTIETKHIYGDTPVNLTRLGQHICVAFLDSETEKEMKWRGLVFDEVETVDGMINILNQVKRAMEDKKPKKTSKAKGLSLTISESREYLQIGKDIKVYARGSGQTRLTIEAPKSIDVKRVKIEAENVKHA